MQGLAGLRPAGRIGTPEAIHDLVHDAEGQIRSPELEGEDHGIDIVEEVQVGMGDLAGHRLGAFGKHDAYGRDVGAPVDPQGCIAVAKVAHRPRGIAVQKALHMRQEAHELAIVPLLERVALDAELVIDQSPVPAAETLEHGLSAFASAPGRRGDELDGPQHDLAEMANDPSLSLAGVQPRMRDRGRHAFIVRHASPFRDGSRGSNQPETQSLLMSHDSFPTGSRAGASAGGVSVARPPRCKAGA